MEVIMTHTQPGVFPTTEESELARESSRQISAYLNTNAETQLIEIKGEDGLSHPVQLPVSALRLFVDILTELGDGNIVNIVPIHAELTSQEAADILNVSRPFLIKLLDESKIPHRMVGTHRRVLYSDVIQYKKSIDEQRQRALKNLAEQAQGLNMGY
jgi:excisionase family DNA binding protein